MALNIKTTANPEDAAGFIASSILDRLKLGKHVLFFVTGGSSIAVAVKVSELLKEHPLENLTIMLTDERYGPIYHAHSNHFKLIEKGFVLPQANFIPILRDEPRVVAVDEFNDALNQEFNAAEYKIGLFGVGVDGHTAGILPDSVAAQSEDLACSYDTPLFARITMTPKAIEKLDEVVVWAQGEDKWGILESLTKKEVDVKKQPAQALKKVTLLTIFTDCPKI